MMTATSGRNLCGSWLNSGPLGSLEKMLLGTSAWVSMTCWLTWKPKTTPQGRLLFQLAPSVHRTDGTGSGLWPTATTSPGRPCEGNVRLLRAKVLRGELTEQEAAQMLNGKSPMAAQGKIPAMWPTPRANKIGGASSERFRPTLLQAVKMWPTPSASMHKGSSPASLTRKSGRDLNNDRLDHAAMATDGGAMNPEWVEWLMGFPAGWTSLETE
jgi:hypothetical protein